MVQPGAGCRDITGLVDTGPNQHGIMLFAQLLELDAAANIGIAAKGDAGVAEMPDTSLDDRFIQLEIRDAIDQQAAKAVSAVIDGYLIADLTQLLGSSDAGRAAADDADRLRQFGLWANRAHPSFSPSGVGNVALDGADRHGPVAGLLNHAVPFAKAVLGADAAADLREAVGRAGDLIGLFQPVLGGQLQPIGNVVGEWAMDLTKRDAALRAAAGLGGSPTLVLVAVDLAEIPAPLNGFPLVRRRLAE